MSPSHSSGSTSGRTLVVNARYASRRITGVERHAHEIVSRLTLPHTMAQPSRVGGHLWEQTMLPFSRRSRSWLYSPCNFGPLAVRAQSVTIHDLSPLRHPEWFSKQYAMVANALTRGLARTSRSIFTVSEFGKSELVELLGVSPSKITVVGNGVSPRFGSAPRINPGRYVLAVGSLQPRKNLTGIIAAFLAASDLGDLELWIAGGTHGAFAADLGAAASSPRIKHLGAVSDSELATLYAEAAAVVAMPFYEGFGLTPLEACAAGTPVAVSDIPPHHEVLGTVASYASPHSVEEMAAAITAAVRSDSEAQRAERRAVGSTHTWERAAARTQAALEGFLSS